METMQRLQAYKYELMPTGNQQRDMRRFAGACRFVYNKALALQTNQPRSREQVHSLCGDGEPTSSMEKRVCLAQGISFPSPSTRPQESGSRLRQLLREANSLPSIQEAWVRRQLPLPTRFQTGSGQQPSLPPQTWLAALPQQPGCSWHGQEYDRE